MYYKKEGFEWNPYRTWAELLEDSCTKYADLVAFSWKEKRKLVEKTYREFGEDVRMVAGKIRTLPAEHVGFVAEISYSYIVSMYAAMVAGKVAVPLEDSRSQEEYQKLISKADIDLVVCSKEQVNEEVQAAPWMSFEELFALEAEGLQDWPKLEPKKPACIFFTSGTTRKSGEETAVLLSQENVATTNITFDRPLKLKTKPKMLLYLPLFHVLAFSGLTCCIAGGYNIILGSGAKYLYLEMVEFRPNFIFSVPMVTNLLKKEIWKGIEKSGKTESFYKGVRLAKLFWKFGIDIRPKVFKEIYDGLGGNLRLITAGGAPGNQETVDFLFDIGIYLLDAYGMTETCGMVSQNTFLRSARNSVGIIMPYNEVKIVDGEIWIRGANVMLGYYKDETATNAVMEDGWLKTGDLGYIDADGYLYITGRKKNLIILSNGINVSPEEIECRLSAKECIQEVVVCEKDGHIHAEIYSESERARVADIIRLYNQECALSHRITSWELRETPFERAGMLKIKRY